MTSAKSWFDPRWGGLMLVLALAGCDASDVDPEAGAESSGGDAAESGSDTTDGEDAEGGSDESESDGDDGDDDDDDDDDDDTPVTCDGSLTACGPECVDTTSDPNNCGACGVACVIPNGAAACDAGVCGLAVCEDGWADCDGTITTGCETENACETGGACATECGSTGNLQCDNPCEPSCALPVESCNFEDDDCDGECDEGAVEGCRVALHRTDDPTYGQILMVNPDDAETYGVTIDQMNWIYLYALPGAGSQPLQRCINGSQLGYSEENNCGTYGAYESTLGFFGVELLCGGVPLTRLTLEATNGTRLAIDQAEIDAYVAQGWEVDPTFVAYAWLEP